MMLYDVVYLDDKKKMILDISKKTLIGLISNLLTIHITSFDASRLC